MTTKKTTPDVALELTCMNIANAAFLLAQTQVRYEDREVKDENGKLVRTVPTIASVRQFVPFLAGFETYFAPLLRDDNGKMQYLPNVGVERRKYIWGPSNSAAEFNFEVHKRRCANAVDLMVNFKEELSSRESGAMLDTKIAQRQHEAADSGFVMLPPEIPEKLHQPTLDKLVPCKEFVADRAAFDLFMVHSVLVNTAQTRYDWTRRSRMLTTSGEPHIEKARDELMDIFERGVSLLEEGQTVEKSVAENDHHEYSVFDLLNGERISNERKNALPIIEYERAMRYMEPAMGWYRWVEVLGAYEEFSINVEQTIRKAIERVEQNAREQQVGTVVRTTAVRKAS